MTTPPDGRGRFGLAMALLAATGVVIAAYLTWQHLAGEIPPCGPVGGGETVLTSPYASIAGIPVALPGVLVSLVTLGGALAWWRWTDRRGLVLAYLAGIGSLAALAYFTYLEVAVIHAICAWCVTYAVTVLAGWLLALAAYRSSGSSPPWRRSSSRPARRGRSRCPRRPGGRVSCSSSPALGSRAAASSTSAPT